MKRVVGGIAIAGLIVLGACSSDSPSPEAVPTPASDTWSLSSLVASNPVPEVDETIILTASVLRNGSPASDGVMVEFLADGGSFSSSGITEAEVATENGSASVYFTATVAGSYVIQARVVSVMRQTTVTYSEPDVPETLQLFGISPNEGPLIGGQQAIITGKFIKPPVDVFFDVGGSSFQAITQAVDSNWSFVQIVTPTITGLDETIEWAADVRVVTEVGVATGGEVDTLPGLYRFQPAITVPLIYILQPDRGSARGGQMVNIIGQNFVAPVEVTLNTPVGTLVAGEESVAPGGQMITFLTPQYSASALSADTTVSVTVVNEANTIREQTITKSNAFIFEADILTPDITGISPTAGPIDGGTEVTIMGSGFEIPVQVKFGEREATALEVTRNQIISVAPDYSTVPGVSAPTVVNVQVTNLESGLSDSLGAAYTYGDSLFISGNQPGSGDRGTVVTIFGSGFDDPLAVSIPDIGLALDVVAVSGTEVVAMIPNGAPLSCADQSGSFQITMIETGLSTTGGGFTYLGRQPYVYAIDPPSVTSTGGGTATTPINATIIGANFETTVQVAINEFFVTAITRIDENTIEVNVLPGPNFAGVDFDEEDCVTGDGRVGSRFVPTGADVTVINIPPRCTETVAGGLVYVPEDTTCRAPLMVVTPPSDPINFGLIANPGCSGTESIAIDNNGTATLTDITATIGGTDAASFIITSPPAATLAPGATTTVSLQFCPAADDNRPYSGTITISGSDTVNSPVVVNLAGTES